MDASCCVLKQPHSEHFDWWQREGATWPHHETSRFAEAAGICWHVQQMGEGPALLLVHGTGASTHSWREVMPLLAPHYAVTAVDLPGHGFSGAAAAARSSIAGIAASLASLLRTLKVSPAYCVGHSAGAVVICRMALDGSIAPREIVSINGAFIPLKGLASGLFSPVARILAGNSLLAELIARRAQSEANVARLIAGTGSKLDEAGVALYARLVRNPRHVAGALRMMGNWDLKPFLDSLAALTSPLTLMVGENDLMVPPGQALTVQRRVAHASVQRLAGLGHLAHEEQPALIAEQLSKVCIRHS
jgi:magnesium chelatase accessory protein